MAIRCGCCGGEHASAAEVRACCAGQAVGRPVDSPSTRSPTARPVARPPLEVLAGPDALGRNLVVAAGVEAPGPWAGCPRFTIDGATLAEPGALVADLRPRFLQRDRFVVELATAFDHPRQVESRPPHELGPGFELTLDALHHAVFANSVDARDAARPRWPWAEAATALGAGPGSVTDVVLPDGTAAWCDGGPLQQLAGAGAIVHRIGLEHGSLAPVGDNATAADLAADQYAAVTHPGGPARIIAPAGSGKTRVLTERARLLLAGWHLPPGALCLVAFNRRAREEMEARTTDLAALRVRTLNALGLSILNGERPFAARPQRVSTIDEVEVRRILGRLVRLPRRRNVDPLATWIEALGMARLGLRDPDAVERRFGGDVPGLVEVARVYRDELRRRNVVDFDEQILSAIELLLADPQARAAAQRACRVLLVDEFQDLTPAHLLLVRLLAAPDGAVFGVGDDDQTIYGYNGADPAWLVEFERYFPGAADHPLEVNYRCPPGVVEGADRLLRNNRRRVAKTIRAAKAGTGGWRAVSSDDPPTATIEVVQALTAAGAAPADVAVLARVNVVLAPVQVGLAEAGVPVGRAVGAELLQRPAVRAALAWLRLATGPFHPGDLAEILRRPSRSLSPRVAEWVVEQRDLPSLGRLGERLRSERDAQQVRSLTADLAALHATAHRGGTADAVDHLLDVVGLAPAVTTLDSTRHGINATAQADDLDALRWLARRHPDAATFEDWLRDALARPGDPAGVTLSSVHRVKGQEWPHVVVHDAAASQFPHRLSDDREEERRVFHVAITRAIESVTIVVPPSPSPFVAELSHEPVESTELPPGAEVRPPASAGRRRERAPLEDPAQRRAADLLRRLRTELRDGKPAYTVFDDATLEAIASVLPQTLVALGRVKGIGPAKLAAYGERILAAVAEAAADPDSLR